MNFKQYTPFIVLLAVLVGLTVLTSKYHTENARLQQNSEALLDSVHHYKVLDSLNASKIYELQLTEKELKKYYPNEQPVIKSLKQGQKLATVEKVITTMHDTLLVAIHDTVVRDNSLKAFNYTSVWTDVNGLILKDSVQLAITNREDLLITQCLEKKKFLFFKLPISLFGYKAKSLSVVSKNPNTQITNVNFITVL